jgi:error-prone DNA polymerase
LKYVYPEEITSEGRAPQEELTMLTWQGAKQMFGEVIPAKTVATIKHELAFIDRSIMFLTFLLFVISYVS